MSTPNDQKSDHVIAVNRRALHDYFVDDRLEAGIELKGTEVKSVRDGQVSFTGSFADITNGQASLLNLNIAPYACGNRFNHNPERPRRLLLHHAQLVRLSALVDQQGQVLIPLRLLLRRGFIKVELGICRGKRQFDKREDLKRKTADRETRQAIAKAR